GRPLRLGRSGSSAPGLADTRVERGEPREVLRPLRLEPLDQRAVLVAAALPLVELARLEQLRIVEAREVLRDEVAEVGVLGPGDVAGDDAALDGRRVRDPDLLRP